MNAVLKAKDLRSDQLFDVIGAVGAEEAGERLRCWIETPDGWAFDWWPAHDGEVGYYGAGRLPTTESVASILSRSTTGRLFAPSGELRWRQLTSGVAANYRCVFLGYVDWSGNTLDDASAELSGLTPYKQRHLLWGRQSDRSPGEWIELRIPHRFRYPCDGDFQRVVVEVEYWRDKTWQPHFVRFRDLYPYPEK